MIEHITLNLANAPIRRERLHGRDHLVAPMVMLVEGVLNGSNGPLFYPGDECKRAVNTWNHRPVVVYHPEINGQGVSACDPAILERQQIGLCLGTRWAANKLRSEAWVDIARAREVDERVLEALETNKMMEVSTGLFTENEDTTGEFNGKPYKGIARNHQPDHLAVLPDKIGACSIADGAGLLQLNEAAAAVGVDVNGLLAQQLDFMRRLVGNAMSHGEIREGLHGMLRKRYGGSEEVWIDDVFDKNLIYHANGKLFLLPYTKNKDGMELSDDAPTEVSRVIRYRTADGTLVGNAATEPPTPETNEMKKEDLVNGLIANKRTAWAEADRATLMAFNEDALAKMAPKDEEEPAADDKNKAKTEPAPTGNAATPAAPVTLDGYLAAAPPQVQTLLRNALAAEEAQKAELIDRISANAANPFTKEFLGTKPLDELRGLAALATANQPQANAAPGSVPMFHGAATPFGAPTANAAAAAEEAYVMPTMNFAAPAAKA
jgi:hypothetical protein